MPHRYLPTFVTTNYRYCETRARPPGTRIRAVFASLLLPTIVGLAIVILALIGVIALITWLVVKSSSKLAQRGAVHQPQDNGKPQ